MLPKKKRKKSRPFSVPPLTNVKNVTDARGSKYVVKSLVSGVTVVAFKSLFHTVMLGKLLSLSLPQLPYL